MYLSKGIFFGRGAAPLARPRSVAQEESPPGSYLRRPLTTASPNTARARAGESHLRVPVKTSAGKLGFCSGKGRGAHLG